MNVHFPAQRRTWPSLLVNIVVVVVVLAMAADTFVQSYSGVHAIVVQAGVSARLARFYPGLFDAVFVIACVAAVMLRGARWWAQWYAWLVIILVVAVVGAADAVHAMNVAVPHRTIEGVVAAAPWALVLLGFGLMLTMLRQSRAQHAPVTAPAEPAYLAPGPAELPEAASVPETHALPVGVWEPLAEPAPEDVPAPEAAPAAADVPAPETAAVPQQEVAQSAEPAAVGEYAAGPDTTDVPVAPEADAGAAAADVDAAGDTGSVEPVEPVEEEPVMAAAAHEEPPSEPEPAVQPEPAAEPVAAGNGESAAAYQEDAAPTTPYNYWDSGADSGFNAPDRVPTVPGGVPTVPGEVIDDDAPPFATAPFAAVPRLNRVRSTPTPPEGDDEED
jgi:hypothetical protein